MSLTLTPRLRIVLADPFHDEIEMYAGGLDFLGFDVIPLTDPDVASSVRLVRKARPDALVTRILPGRFGIDLVRQLRKDPEFAAMPMLILTSITHPETLHDARTSGANDVLVIPVTPDSIAERLRHHVRRPRRA